MRRHVLRFDKIGRAGIEPCIQIIDFNEKWMRNIRVYMAGMIVGRHLRISRGKEPVKGFIHAREPRLWLVPPEFKLALYGSEQPEPR